MVSSPAMTSTTREKIERARTAASALAQFSTEQKNSLLLQMADAIEARSTQILASNEQDLALANMSGAMRDRLLLNDGRISEMATSVREVARLADPVNQVIEEWTRPNGLLIRKVRVPLGVVGIVYESRPNVTVDAAVLAFKTGNAVVLRGGKEAAHSNRVLAEIISGISGVPPGAIELLDSSTRETVQELITARGLVDVVIPRGGPALISHVIENALVPAIETGAGNCHIFVDDAADLDMAGGITMNAKTQRPSVCNAAEKLIVHRAVAQTFLPRIAKQLANAGVELRGDQESRKLEPGIAPATE